ncbi:hypothetical protein [Puia sp.]|jgi:hypothetical protein|uniref:hypothetical protein n=1 Tax=Puia sp. TaxID=2045100 RepID=UPI002F3E5F19
MAELTIIPAEVALKEFTARKAFPLTFAWSRLEGRPHTDEFERALKAEVRDASWMLCKQWQMGEFQGEDAGSPVTAKLCTSTTELDKYQADSKGVQAFDKEIPFEAKVEQRPLPFSTFQQDISLDLRLVMGRRWLQLVNDNGVLTNDSRKFFLDHYGFKKPDPTQKTDAAICAHVEAWQQFAAVAGRMVDGAALYADWKTVPHYYDDPSFPAGLDHNAFDKAETDFTSWYRDLFYQPDDPVNDAWEPAQLEYQFYLSAPESDGQKLLHAEGYYQGHLDWYNVNVDRKDKPLGPLPDGSAPVPPAVPPGVPPVAPPVVPPIVPPGVPPVLTRMSLIPTPVTFAGMPNTRWWAFEDAKTNFGAVKPDTTGLARSLLIEFGLVYANDWYLVPYDLPVGSLTAIKGLSVTNSFGENFWIEAADKGSDADTSRWDMFTLKVDSNQPVAADTDLLLLPTVARIQESPSMEEVLFIRDEVANMVWGVETIIPLPSGWSKSGFGAAAEYFGLLQKQIDDLGVVPPPEPPVADGDEVAKIRYEIMNTVPENWIPFIPTHVDGSNREVQLQRAAMPRILENNPSPKPDKVRPRTALLQEGLPDKKAYFIHEEEVPRSGIIVAQGFKRTRWANGKVFVWFGARKTTGRGEGSSGLGFDLILNRDPTPPAPPPAPPQ